MEKQVLILCTGNSCRSIIAEALVNFTCKNIKAHSAGVKASGKVNENAKKVLQKKGIWREKYYSKSIEKVMQNHYDLVVTVCDHAKETCPQFFCENVLHVSFEDPDGKSFSEFEKTYEDIKNILIPKIQNILK